MGWLNLTDKDKVWSLSIREYLRNLERSLEDDSSLERGDCLLWTLVQLGLASPKGEKTLFNDQSLQICHYAAVGLSRLWRKLDFEKSRLDQQSKDLKELERVLYASDQATTVRPA